MDFERPKERNGQGYLERRKAGGRERERRLTTRPETGPRGTTRHALRSHISLQSEDEARVCQPSSSLLTAVALASAFFTFGVFAKLLLFFHFLGLTHFSKF